MTEDSGRSKIPSFLLVGKIIRPHGVRGAVIVEPISDCPVRFEKGSQMLVDYRGVLKKSVTVVSSISFKGRILVKFAEIQSRDDAEGLRECDLVIPQSEADSLKEGEYWVHELEGMAVEDENGEKLGEVSDVILGAHQDLLVVSDSEGHQFMVPFVRAFIADVDRESRVIRIRPVEGLMPGKRGKKEGNR